MKMECPHCGVNGTVDDSLVGKKVKCPKCVNTFVINAEGSAPIEVEALANEAYGAEEMISTGDILSDTADDLDISDLLRSEESKDSEFPSEECAACGQAVHPALLMDVNSKMYCAGCVPEHILFDEEEAVDEEAVDEEASDFGLSPSLSSEDDDVPVAPVSVEKTTGKKADSSNVMKLFLLFSLIALGCIAAIVFLDIKLF